MRKFRAFIEQSVRAPTFTAQLRRFCFVGLRTPPITWRDMIFVVYSSANSPLKQATGSPNPGGEPLATQRVRGKGYQFFRYLSEKHGEAECEWGVAMPKIRPKTEKK